MHQNYTSTQPKSKLLFLDGLRGIAALYVMIGHARWLLWEGYQNFLNDQGRYTIFDKGLMYFFSFFKWGHEFVLLFFVLSGFVIHYGYALKLSQNNNAKISWKDYLIRRAKRIYPPFLFAILLTFALDSLGNFFNLTIYTGKTLYPSINTNVGNPDHGLNTFIGNIFFLYKEYVPIFGTNGPTWSLKFEWWFYMIYPMFFFLTRKGIFYSTAVIVLLFSASFFSDLWPAKIIQEIFGSIICWWLGVLLAEVATKRVKLNLVIFGLVACFTFALSFFWISNSQILDLRTALLFTFIMSAILWLSEKGFNFKILEALKPLGDFSYTLYIIHFPILVLMSGFLMNYNYTNKLPAHSYFIFAGIFVCMVVAYLVHFVVEKPFMKKAKSVDKQVSQTDVKVLKRNPVFTRFKKLSQ